MPREEKNQYRHPAWYAYSLYIVYNTRSLQQRALHAKSKTQNACFPFLSTRPIGNLLQLNGSKAFLRVLDCVKTVVWSVHVTRRLRNGQKKRRTDELFFSPPRPVTTLYIILYYILEAISPNTYVYIRAHRCTVNSCSSLTAAAPAVARAPSGMRARLICGQVAVWSLFYFRPNLRTNQIPRLPPPFYIPSVSANAGFPQSNYYNS